MIYIILYITVSLDCADVNSADKPPPPFRCSELATSRPHWLQLNRETARMSAAETVWGSVSGGVKFADSNAATARLRRIRPGWAKKDTAQAPSLGMRRLKIAANLAYRRAERSLLNTGFGRGATNFRRPHLSHSGEGGVAWRFQIPSAVARLRDNARRGVSVGGVSVGRLSGACAPSHAGDDPRAWIDTRMIGRSSSLKDFYDAYFSATREKRVIQVGANDGIMCDPLRRFLAATRNQNISVVLIEPLPFYFAKLSDLYRDYPGVTVVNVACGVSRGRAPLYFIKPDVADKMNGNGPANNWAHGQGSFDPNVIRYWIERNRFRGEEYVRDVDTYLQSIISVEVDIIPLSDIALSRQNENLLVVIDVQGFELDVLRGIDWDHPPAYIVLEDDLNKAGPIGEYLAVRGYCYLCGRNDKLYAHGLTSRT